ncbi:MAG: cytochrome c [Gemmatimonadetes bacterium]|nr:cytochrome c [Gemmatimonadota bacterium]
MRRGWYGGLGAAALLACGGGSGGGSATMAAYNPGRAPAELQRGAALYGSYCASCHGALGKGQGLGPPLLDTLFLPARISDAQMTSAILAGSPQRHWNYGAMPPVTRVDPAEVPQVVAYVRWLQSGYHAGGTTGSP